MRRFEPSALSAQTWPRAAQAELRALEAEGDSGLYFRQLLGLGRRLEADGREALAAELYASIAPDPAADEALRGCARQALEAVTGRGAWGPRAEFLLRRLTREATHPVTIFALSAGSSVFSLTRLVTLSRLLQAPAGVMSRGWGARGLASLTAFAAEAPAFTLAARLGNEALGRPQDWDSGALGRELASSYLVLGGLKLAGWASGRAYRAAWRLGGPPTLQGLFQQGGMMAGILSGHALEERLGLRPRQDGATTWVDSLALLLQSHVAGRLGSRLLGGVPEAWNRRLDLLAAAPPPAPPAPAWVAAGVGVGWRGPSPQAPRAGALMMSSSGENGGASRRPPPAPQGGGWLDKFLQALERYPHWLTLIRGPSESRPPEAEGGGPPYRRPGRPYGTLAEARARSTELRRAALDSDRAVEFRAARLAELPSYLEGLRLDPEYGKALDALERLVLKPGIPYPPVPGWPEVLLQREIPLPEPVVEYYRQDRQIRLQAADLYVQLQLENPLGTPAIRRAASFLAESVLEPRLNTKYRTYFREDVWSRAYFEAEATLRRDFLQRYIPIAQRLPVGSEEARAGVRMLLSPKLLGLVRGRGPVPDYLSDPELLLDMMRAYGGLLRLLPSSLPEVQRADRLLSPVLLAFGERAMEGEPGALEILALFAKSDPSARQVLEMLASQGNPIAGKLLAQGFPEG